MGWMDAPEVQGGAAWEKAPVSEDVVMTTPDGGRVVRSQSGKLSFVSPGYSTSDPETIKRIMEGQGGGAASRQNIQESLIEQYPVASRLTSLVEGTPFVGSYLDELIGGVAGPEAGAGVRALSSSMQEQRPIQSTLLGLGGAGLGTAATIAATPVKLAAALMPSVSGRLLPSILRSGATAGLLGGIEGAIYGSGQGEGEGRAENAITGGLLGTAFGGTLGAAAPLVGRGVENVAGLFRRSDVAKIAADLGISREAATVIKNTFDQGGDFAAARAALQRAGSEGMLADAGFAAQALLDASAATGGRAGQITREAVEGRMTRTGEALTQNLDTALGPAPLGPRSAVDAIAARTAPARSEAYGLAYQTPINYASPKGMRIEEVLGRVSPDDLIAGIVEANKEMRSNGQVNQQIMAVLGADGNVEFLREMPNVQQLDEIKKALQKIAYDNTDDFGRLTGTGKRYNRLAGELRDAVSDAVPDYGTAVGIGGDKLAEERAFMLGRDLLSTKTEIEDVAFELGKKPSSAQVDAAKLGLRSYIEKTLGDVRAVPSDPNIDARQVIKAVTDMSSDNARAKIRSLMGAEAETLLRQIDEAAQSAIVRAAVSTNSKTAIRTGIRESVEEMTTPGILGQAMAGDPINTSKSLIQAITGQTAEYTAIQRQRIFEDIARALTEKKGKTAQAALDYLEQAMRGQPLTAAQNEFLARQVAGTAMIAGIPAAQELGER
jgi:hypothetical protein